MWTAMKALLGLGLLGLTLSCGGEVCEFEGVSYARGESRDEPLCEDDTGMVNTCTCNADGSWSCTDLGAICDTSSP